MFRPITDANTRVAEMLSGGIDVMVEIPPDSVQNFDGNGFTLYEQAGPHLWFLILNAKEGPFADKRVRQAINYAIDKKTLVEDICRVPPRSPPAQRRRPSPGPITRRCSPIPMILKRPKRFSKKRDTRAHR